MIRLLDFLVCDDVREEKSGKFTLVGVYSDGIIVTSRGTGRPHLPKIGMFIRIGLDEGQPRPDAFKLECFSGETKFFAVEGTIESVAPNRTLAIGLVAGMVPLGPSMPLRFDLQFRHGSDSEAVRVHDVPVTFRVEEEANE